MQSQLDEDDYLLSQLAQVARTVAESCDMLRRFIFD